MVCKHLRWKLETSKLISASQFGSRNMRSTTDLLVNLEADICDALASNFHLLIVSLDNEKAYEMVWISGLITQTKNLGFSGNIFAFISNFLSGRKIRVRIGNLLSNKTPLENGLPQGSALSVLLFLIAIDPALSCIREPLKRYMFVDDLSFSCCGGNIDLTLKTVQETLNSLQSWADTKGFKFSASKSEFMLIKRGHMSGDEQVALTLNNQPINRVYTMKILGLTIDSKVTWAPHISKLKNECNSRIRILKVLSSVRWGADFSVLITIYKALIRSKMDYGAIIYDSAKTSTLKTLDTIQNTAFRLCLGAFRTSPSSSLAVEAGEPALDLRREELCLKYAATISSNPANPAHHNTFKDYQTTQFAALPQLPKPLRIRIRKYFNSLNFTLPPIHSRSLGQIPPWVELDISIDLTSSQYNRQHTPPEIYRLLFRELRHKYAEHNQYYTDGSKVNQRTGYAITTNNQILESFRLQDYCSIFTCEAFAILNTINIIRNGSNSGKNVIFTDSMSCLQAIRNQFCLHPLIQQIHQVLEQTTALGYTIALCWIPSHQGIPGNEMADEAARRAIELEIHPHSKLTHQEAIRVIHNRIIKFWDQQWLQQAPSYLHAVRNSVLDKGPNLTRPNQCIISRLRIGHTNFSHIHLITKASPNTCPRCGCRLTVKHLLLECSNFNVERSTAKLPNDLKAMLSDPDNCANTIKFLKTVEMYKRI